MNRWSKTRSLIFLAALAVYPVGALAASPERQASSPDGKATEVRLLDETAGPIAAATAAGAPTTKPADPANQQVNVTDLGTVDIQVSEANLVDVLRMLAKQAQRNIVASKEVRGTVTASLYRVTIREALDAILKANGYGYREKGSFIYVYSAKELADIEKNERQMVSRVFPIYYLPVADAEKLVKNVLSTNAKTVVTSPSKNGISPSGTETGGDSHADRALLVITDYPDNVEEAKKVLKEADRRPQQVLVEATILQTTLTENNALGVDITAMGGVDFQTLTGGKPTSSGSTGSTGSSGGSSSNTGPTVGDVLTGNILNVVGAGAVTEKGFVAGRVGGGGLQIGAVKDSIGVFVTALEGITDTVVLANPKVLVVNKQKGEFKVVRKDPYFGKIDSSADSSNKQQEVQFQESGTKLIFRPFIGDDGFIRLEVHPEDSSIAGTPNNGLPPTQISTEMTTNVMVKDGHTIVIGGLFRESSQTDRSQVPGLGEIPVLGYLFRKQADTTARQEVIILLTPHIVKDERLYAEISEEQARDLERMRVGVRRGMMPFGRSRLAECCYDNAVNEMNKATPDRKKALWYIDCSLNLNPKFLEAVKMKESLTGKEITETDGSSIRGFVAAQILADRASIPAADPAEEKGQNPASSGKTMSVVPSTQPATSTVAAAKPAAPATQPVPQVQGFDPKTAGLLLEKSGLDAAAAALKKVMAAEPAVAAPPTTQPATETNSAVVVNELPDDDK